MKKNNNESNKITDQLTKIRKSLENIYSDTYYSSNSNSKNISDIGNDIANIIKTSSRASNSPVDKISNISKLLVRATNNQEKNIEYQDQLDKILLDPSVNAKIINEYTNNKWIKDLDAEYDTILKYNPKLQEAINIKVDNILSADNFSKEFLSLSPENTTADVEVIESNIKQLRRKYKFDEMAESIVQDICTYGEVFISIIPYKAAFEKLLKNKQKIKTEVTIFENGIMNSDFDNNNVIISHKSSSGTFNLTLDLSGSLSSIIENYNTANSSIQIINDNYNKCGYTHLLEQKNQNDSNKSGLIYDALPGNIASENLSSKNSKINVYGAVCIRLDREKVIPIYIEKICLGYFYVDIHTNNTSIKDLTGTSPHSVFSNMFSSCNNSLISSSDEFCTYIAKQISNFIDANFINKNVDITKELYYILKHSYNINTSSNINMGISFIPVEDMNHLYFKFDEKTHRGVSDINNSLISGKILTLLNFCTAHGILTRSLDKRVYYVKQTVDTNISQTLMNVLVQIQKGNFGIRQIENINNILGVTGQFNDYVIPVGQNGESPITMEVMNGQRIEIPTDFLTNLEESMISTSDVPLELVNSVRGPDYAIAYTMSNSKFLRHVYRRQAKLKAYLSNIFSRIYNCEYNTNIEITASLPAPAFLAMTNSSQLINNTSDYINLLMDSQLIDEDETTKSIFKKKMIRYYLSTHIDTSVIDKFLEEAQIEASIIKKNEE